MTRFLVATDSVHATAAVCDHLADRRGPDDPVLVVGLADAAGERDAADAVNVATARLPGAETAVVEGDPATAVADAAAEFDADRVVAAGDGARALVGALPVVLVVVPDPA